MAGVSARHRSNSMLAATATFVSLLRIDNLLLLLFRSAVAGFGRHAAEIRTQSGAETKSATANRPDERARFIQAQRCYVAAKIIPNAVLLQVLLDICEIESAILPV